MFRSISVCFSSSSTEKVGKIYSIMIYKLCSVVLLTSAVIGCPLLEENPHEDTYNIKGEQRPLYKKRSPIGVVENSLLAVKKKGTELKLNVAATKLVKAKTIFKQLLEPVKPKGSELALELAASKFQELKKTVGLINGLNFHT